MTLVYYLTPPLLMVIVLIWIFKLTAHPYREGRFGIYKDETETYIARDLYDAMLMQRQHCGMTIADQNEMSPPDAWIEVRLDETISIAVDGTEASRIKKTGRKWVRECGEGFLCSTEW